MNLNLKRGLVFAMESEGGEAVPVVDPTVVPATAAEVETATAEVTEQVGEAEQMDTAIETAEADAGTLENIQEVMADSVESGEGLSEDAAKIAEVAIESICARMGIQNKQKVMPSVESFGSKSSRVLATKLAMESVMDTIKTIWNNILKAIKWVFEKIKSVFLSLTKSRSSLLKHLEALQGQVKAFDGAEGAKTVTGSAVKAFTIGGKADASTAHKVLGDSSKVIKNMGTGAKQAASLVHRLTDVKGTGADLSKAGTELLDAVRGSMESLGKVEGGAKAAEGKVKAVYGNLAYGRSVGIESDEKASSVFIALEETGGEAAKEAAALSKDEMAKLLTEAIALTKELQAYDAIEKDLEKITKACEGVAQAVINGNINATKDEKKAGDLKQAAANIKSLNGMVAKFGASLPSAVFQAAKAAGDYVSASLGAAGKKEKKEEAKA